MVFPVRRILPAILCVAATAASVGVGAQQVWRIVGPDGRVTFSDRPPAERNARPAAVEPAGEAPASTAPPTISAAALPYALRAVVSRFPVTLYSGSDCGPCASGRIFLQNSGIPFVERTVTSPADVDAFTRLFGTASVPLLTIGSQQLNGFSETEWTQYLDAAGYPRNAQLPTAYRNPAPAPLVAQQVTPRTVTLPKETQRQAAPVQLPPPTSPSNPAGIRF